jgi:hypothetical protein
MRSRQLNSSDADSAAGTVDQNLFSRSSLRRLKQRSVSREIRNVNGRACSKDAFSGSGCMLFAPHKHCSA